MKKLFFVAVAFAAISLTSCKNEAKPAADADSTAVDTTMVDSMANDSAAAQMVDSAAQTVDTAAVK